MFFFAYLLSFGWCESFYETWKRQFDDPTESFLETHPNAPAFKKIQKNLEQKKTLSKAWCMRFEWITSKGAVQCFQKTGDTQKLRRFWRENLTASNDVYQCAKPFLKDSDHNDRLSKFFYTSKNPSRFLCSSTYFPIAKARQECMRGRCQSAQKLSACSDSGLIYSLILCLKKKGDHEKALYYLKKNLDDPHYGDEWGAIRLFYGRYLLERKRYPQALSVLNHKHNQISTDIYANLEFLKGLGYYLANQKNKSHAIWMRLYHIVKKRNMKAQCAYWASRCANRKKWLDKASQYQLTFYGEMAACLLNNQSTTSRNHPQWAHSYFSRLLLSLPKSASRSDVLDFIEAAVDDTDKDASVNSVVRAVGENFGPFYGVWCAKRFSRFFSIQEGYPVLHSALLTKALQPIALDNAWFRVLLHSLIRQESLFDPKIKSSANAIGLTQLLYPTAQKEVSLIRLKHNLNISPHLTTPYNNILIGAFHLNRLLDLYNGNFIFACAAYNAGRKRAEEWIKDRNFNHDALLWIEMIPFAETREYVKKVTENTLMYSKKFNIKDPLKKIFFKKF